MDFRIFQKEINRYMYIPQKSGHASHTIKNYVLGELKRYIRYSSLKLAFLKIRTKLFSRLRNRGFKKVWLRKHFATLKYEDREKLLMGKEPDSITSCSISHSDCQTVLEKEAESLRITRSLLADTDPNQKDMFDIEGMRNIFPMEPHRPIGGTISGHHYNQEKTRLIPTLNTSVIQESIWNTPPATILQKAAATFAASASPTSKNLAEKETMEVCGRRKINEAEKLTSSVMYLVLPSFAEPHKHTIKKILEAEKAKLRINSQVRKCFDAIEFKLAFTNSKNIKQLIVRTKI